MPRSDPSINDIITDAVSKAMRTILPAIERQIAEMAAAELDKKLAVQGNRKGARGPTRSSRARPVDITRWVADRRARRVPNFVIEMTGGLDTKKKIVAKFGENAAFEKGKPLPAASAAAHRAAPGSAAVAARIVKARPPVVRKAVGK